MTNQSSHRPQLSIPLFLYDKESCIYTRDGRLVWFSPRWIRADVVARTELLGLRYLEYMAPGETARFLRWLRNDDLRIEYHYFSPTMREWVLVHMVKDKFDADHWLCLGERLPSRRNEQKFTLEEDSPP